MKIDTINSTTSLNGFTDRGSVSSYAVNAMRWAVSRGVMSGTTSTTLSPQSNITRAQLAAMLKLMMEKTAG